MRNRSHLWRSCRTLAGLFSAAALLVACGDDANQTTGASGSTSSGSGGGGGSGGGSGSTFYVGVARELINPVIVEKDWDDADMNGYFDTGETFTDTNMNGVFDATWIAGFGSGRPATGQNDDLEARAIAFKQGDTTIVICILDVVGYFVDEIERIRQDPTVADLGLTHVIIGSTHVHEGVDTVGMWGETPLVSGRNDAYQQLTRDAAAKAISAAVQALRPARMRIAQTQTVDVDAMTMAQSTLAYHNDTRDPVIYDPTVTIAKFTDDADPNTTIATLVNWAAHPEYSGSRNNLLSADYVHWLREGVEQGFPGEGIQGVGGMTVFVQGPLGGQVGPGGGTAPIDANGMPVTSSGLPKAEAVGRNVAKLALDALASTGEDVDPVDSTITFRTKEIEAQIDNAGYHLLGNLGVFDRQFYNNDPTMPPGPNNIPWAKTRVSYLQVGPMATITAPGELHPELWVGGYDGSWSWGQMILTETVNAPDLMTAPVAPYLRDLMLTNPGVKYAFVSGLSEDFLGYIVASFNYVLHPTNPYFAEAPGEHYEETNSIGPLVEEQLQHPMLELATPP
jgi:hypothetical protein